MIITQTAEKPHILHELLIVLILLNDNLLDSFTEGVPVNGPQAAVLACFDGKSAWGFV